MSILVPEESVEALSRQTPPTIELSKDHKNRIAALAWELTRKELEAANMGKMPPWSETAEAFKANSRRTVTRILQALKMLGYIE